MSQQPANSRSGLKQYRRVLPGSGYIGGCQARGRNVARAATLSSPSRIGGQPFGNQNARPRGRRPPACAGEPPVG